MVLDLLLQAPLDRPISLARELQRFGFSLHDAHKVLNDLKAKNQSVVQLNVSDLTEAVDTLSQYGITMANISSRRLLSE